jgi:hypothetical protein
VCTFSGGGVLREKGGIREKKGVVYGYRKVKSLKKEAGIKIHWESISALSEGGGVSLLEIRKTLNCHEKSWGIIFLVFNRLLRT